MRQSKLDGVHRRQVSENFIYKFFLNRRKIVRYDDQIEL